MRVRVAAAGSLVALLAVVASATAEPPTPISPYAGPMTAVTIPIAPASDAPSGPDAEGAPSVPPPAVLADPGDPPVPTLGPRTQPAADIGVFVKPTPTPKPTPKPKPVAKSNSGSTSSGSTSSGKVLRGLASWYCNNDGSRAQISACHYQYPDTGSFNAYAAAGPKLRAALGGGERWRNRVVSVNGVRVKLVDWCQCYKGQSHEKIIDLYLDVFRRTGGQVTIRW